MILYNNDILHERVVEHLKKNGVEVPYVLARNILFMCDEALRDAPQNKSSNSNYSKFDNPGHNIQVEADEYIVIGEKVIF